MPLKTKTNNLTECIATVAANSGIVLMAAAATLGIVELPQSHNKRVTLVNRPAFAFASQHDQQDSNPLRREREEAGPHYISYNVAQRTPGRTGRI